MLDLPGMKRPKVSGPNIPSSQRHTVKLDVRCKPELAAEARELTKAKGVTLADILAAGIAALKGENE